MAKSKFLLLLLVGLGLSSCTVTANFSSLKDQASSFLDSYIEDNDSSSYDERTLTFSTVSSILDKLASSSSYKFHYEVFWTNEEETIGYKNESYITYDGVSLYEDREAPNIAEYIYQLDDFGYYQYEPKPNKEGEYTKRFYYGVENFPNLYNSFYNLAPLRVMIDNPCMFKMGGYLIYLEEPLGYEVDDIDNPEVYTFNSNVDEASYRINDFEVLLNTDGTLSSVHIVSYRPSGKLCIDFEIEYGEYETITIPETSIYNISPLEQDILIDGFLGNDIGGVNYSVIAIDSDATTSEKMSTDRLISSFKNDGDDAFIYVSSDLYGISEHYYHNYKGDNYIYDPDSKTWSLSKEDYPVCSSYIASRIPEEMIRSLSEFDYEEDYATADNVVKEVRHNYYSLEFYFDFSEDCQYLSLAGKEDASLICTNISLGFNPESIETELTISMTLYEYDPLNGYESTDPYIVRIVIGSENYFFNAFEFVLPN